MSALYGTLSVVLLVAALVMALIVRPPPPPSIAELGPSPQEQIEEARENQAAGSGSGDLATGSEEKKENQTLTKEDGPSATTTPPTTSSTKKVPGTRRCYGDPPRQTEDPHSPPCVFEIYQGDNGGDTTQGVTSTAIHLAFPNYNEPTRSELEAVVAHFNRRYEFYGRRIFIDYIDTTTAPEFMSPNQTKALGDEVISRRPFASVMDLPQPYQAEFHRRLAESRIHSVQSSSPAFLADDLIDGWTWLLSPSTDVQQRISGDFICQAFNGRVARHAGPGVSGKRKFAVVAVARGHQFYPDTDTLLKSLDHCSANFQDFAIDEMDHQKRTALIQDLKLNGFTTVVIVGGNVFAGTSLRQFSASSGYYPEWFTFDLANFWHTEAYWDQPGNESRRQAFGFTPVARVRPEAESPAFWALQDGGSSGNYSLTTYGTVVPFYKKLLIVASGVQMAGPNLTPESFRRALWETMWPNPNPGVAPYWQQRVSLGPGDPVFYDDYAIWWWDEGAPSQTNGGDADGRGSFCYLNRGTRFAPGMFPSDADSRLFKEQEEPCR